MSSYNSDEPNSQDSQPSEEEINAQKEMILKRLLVPEARLRLNNVRMVKPDLANNVEHYIISMATQGKIGSQITDEQLKQILMSIQQPKRDFKINRR